MFGLSFLALLILTASLPAIAVYLWFRIARSSYSTVWFLLLLLVGAAACFPALLLQSIIPSDFSALGRWSSVVQTFVRIALTEEFSRLLVLLVFFAIANRINPNWQENRVAQPQLQTETETVAVDTDRAAIVYGAAAGLVAGFGFAILESATYGNVEVKFVLLRTFSAAPLHGACGAWVGSAAMLLRTNPGRTVSRFLYAVALHGIYDIMLNRSIVVAILVALLALASSIRLVRSGLPRPTEMPQIEMLPK